LGAGFVPSRSAEPPQLTIAVAPTMLAPNANDAARPSRTLGKVGGGRCASETLSLQNGHAVSVFRM